MSKLSVGKVLHQAQCWEYAIGYFEAIGKEHIVKMIEYQVLRDTTKDEDTNKPQRVSEDR